MDDPNSNKKIHNYPVRIDYVGDGGVEYRWSELYFDLKIFSIRQSPPSALQTMDLKVADLRKILNKLLFKSERKVTEQLPQILITRR
jgi:hypothetical protein